MNCKMATGNYDWDQEILMRMWEKLEIEPDIEDNGDNESLADDFIETIDTNTDWWRFWPWEWH